MNSLDPLGYLQDCVRAERRVGGEEHRKKIQIHYRLRSVYDKRRMVDEEWINPLIRLGRVEVVMVKRRR